MINGEDFEAWRANPVTEYVMNALANRAEQIKASWLGAAWVGRLDPMEHAATSAMYEAYRTLSEMTLADVLFVNGDSTEDADETDRPDHSERG